MGFAEQIAARAAAKAAKKNHEQQSALESSIDQKYQYSKPTEVPMTSTLGLVPLMEDECRDDNDDYETQVEVRVNSRHSENDNSSSNKSPFAEQLKMRKKLISTPPTSPTSSSSSSSSKKNVNADFNLTLVDKKVNDEVNLPVMNAANEVNGTTTKLKVDKKLLSPTENEPKHNDTSSSSSRSMLESSCDVSTIKWLASQTTTAKKTRQQVAQRNEHHLSPAVNMILKQLEEKNEEQQTIAAQSVEGPSSSIQQSKRQQQPISQVVADRKYQFRRLKAQIDELKQRLMDAEERVIQERQRADAVAFENRLLKQDVSWGDESMDGKTIQPSRSMPSRHLRY